MLALPDRARGPDPATGGDRRARPPAVSLFNDRPADDDRGRPPARGALRAGDPLAMADRIDLLDRLCLACPGPGSTASSAPPTCSKTFSAGRAGQQGGGRVDEPRRPGRDRVRDRRPLHRLRCRKPGQGRLRGRQDAHADRPRRPEHGGRPRAAARRLLAMVEPFISTGSTRRPDRPRGRGDHPGHDGGRRDRQHLRLAQGPGGGGDGAGHGRHDPARCCWAGRSPAQGRGLRRAGARLSKLPTVQGLVIGRSLLYPPGDDVASAVDTAVGLLQEGR